ncbi:hypothetical protein BVC80_437g9 [Macleaya cordata]|uniref:Uncharacterized protein n=1 Tax=Macleaya cordata TaxID=56857 RepID=A0A200PT23_MACCD|nr:hypothetical protein BVC80_437g9 [Macleaya cordata]
MGGGKVGGATKISQQIDRLCETVESKTSMTEKWLKGSQGSSISEVVELLESLPGVEHGSNLWLSAIDLFKSSQVDRDIFCSIKDSEKKLQWLNHELAKK